MQQIAFKMHLLPGKMQEYKKRHIEIWPELVTLLKEAGVSEYYIFLDEETNILFGSYKAENLSTINGLPGHAVMQKWWRYMEDIMVVNEDHSPVSVPLKEMFYLP